MRKLILFAKRAISLDELDFIRAILDAPHDPSPRQIYADWLEERGDQAARNQAEFLRTECQLDSLSPSDKTRYKLRQKLRALSKLIDVDWWRMLDSANVEYCITFEFECPKRWDSLQLTDDSEVRHCDLCDKNVYHCQNVADARRHAAPGHCVALDSRMPRVRGALTRRREGGRRLLGRLSPHVPRRIPLGERTPPRQTPGERGA